MNIRREKLYNLCVLKLLVFKDITIILFKNKIVYYLMYGQRIWIGVQELNEKGCYQL